MGDWISLLDVVPKNNVAFSTGNSEDSVHWRDSDGRDARS
jgi:hypothetical protein